MANNIEALKQAALTAKAQKEEAEATLAAKKQDLTDKIAMLTKAWEISNAEVIKETELSQITFIEIDGAIRQLAIGTYKDTGEKQIGFGVSVRVNTAYEYDEQKAVDYAISHNMPHLLKVDGTKFKKYASITPVGDWLKTVETVSAVVSYTEK